MTDADGLTFLRYEVRPVTYAVLSTGAGEMRMTRGRMELRQVSMIHRGDACPDTTKALSEWPTGKEQNDE